MTTSTYGPGRFESASRKIFDALHPDPAALDLHDIAISLGNICRFGGHIRAFFSVADHSRFVARILETRGEPPIVQLAGLMHDVVEIITGDVISPMKAIYGENLEEVENLWTPVVEAWIGLPVRATWARPVKTADLAAYCIETRELRGWLPPGAGAYPSESLYWETPNGPYVSGVLWREAVKKKLDELAALK
jgi:hypothetical protein